MCSNRFKQLDAFHKNNQVIYLESLHSEMITQFNFFYKQLNNIVKEIDDRWLNELFLKLKKYFSYLRSSIVPYDRMISEDIYTDINGLFERIAQYKDNEETDMFLYSFGILIGEIKTGFYENVLPQKISEIIEGNEKVAIINYYWTPNLNSPFGENTELIKLKKYKITEKYYDKAIFIGSPSYYSASYELVNSIQKANQIFYICYDIYSSNLVENTIIKENTTKYSKLFSGFSIKNNSREVNIFNTEESDEYFDVREASSVHNWVNNLAEQSSDKRSTIPSYVFELESDRAIIYPENGSLYVVNEENLKVKK